MMIWTICGNWLRPGLFFFCMVSLLGSSIVADTPPAPAEKKSISSQQAELPKLTPKEQQEVQTWVRELQRQRATNRTRAEKHLRRVGAAAVPYLLPVSRSEFDLARIAALRILHRSPRYEAASSALEGLRAENRWVRKLSWQLIEKISGIRSTFPWDGDKFSSQRKRKAQIWQRWYRLQEQLCRQEEKLSRESQPQGSQPQKSAKSDPPTDG